MRLSANEHYAPAYVGGLITGLQIVLENTTASSITAASRNGIYYVYQGQKFQLLNLDGVTVPAYEQKNVSVTIPNGQTVPSTDIKLMVDTAGLQGVTVTATILWSV